ncbi:MAG: alpha/beta hydrolase [Chloroflexota bacterium]
MKKLPSRQEVLNNFISTSHGSFMLEGDKTKPIFLFIHGFATYIDDLIPLAFAFHNEGYTCDLLALKGHGGSQDDLINSSYAEWYEQVKVAYFHHKEQSEKVYIIGFSLGALLAIDLAREQNVDGIIGISTFLAPPANSKTLYRLLGNLPLLRFTRMLQVSAKSTKKELSFNRHLPLQLVGTILEQAKRVQRNAYAIEAPILLLHSLDDKAADYNAIAEMYYTLQQQSRLVTFRSLNHFIQFDIPAARIVDLGLYFFKLKQVPEDEVSGEETLRNMYLQVSEEAKQWASHIFNLIVGFFSLFGALVYFSFESVANVDSRAPYFALLYSFSANIYLTLIILYFFYLNRNLAYTKHHLEPLMTFVTWVSYKSYKWIAGFESVVMTGAVSVLLFLLPISISIGSIWYCLYYFPSRFISFAPENIFLQIMALLSISMLLFNIALGALIRKTSESELHGGIVRARYTNMLFEKLLIELYSSIKPGIVKQPWEQSKNVAVPNDLWVFIINIFAVLSALFNAPFRLIMKRRNKKS